MTLQEIYRELRPASKGFVQAVQTHCGFDLSNEEIERLAENCKDATDFQQAYDNEDWWQDNVWMTSR